MGSEYLVMGATLKCSLGNEAVTAPYGCPATAELGCLTSAENGVLAGEV